MTTIDSSTFTEQWQRWHTARENDLTAPHGWLAITRLEWLSGSPQRFDGIPGTWYHDGVAAYQTADELGGPRRFELGPTAPGELVDAGRTKIEVAHRGDDYILRVHDPAAPALRAFHGVPAYAPDPGWVVEARYEPFDEPRPVTVGAVAEGLQHVYFAPGIVRFTRDGAEYTLTAFNGNRGGFNILFTDATSGDTTYAANRSLVTADPVDGVVTLDFNRAVNLPCAFIDLATCPLPPAGNHLPFAVTAGEKIPHERAR